MIKLSKRLQTIADLVTDGSRIADIGSDHALLPVYLVQSGKSPSAVAGELPDGPFLAAKKQTAEAGLKSVIQVRQGDGLSVLNPGEVDTVTIAGMGGSLMADILEAGWRSGKLAGVTELVLQPNVGEDLVRRWLISKGFVLQGEMILEEDGRIYEVLHAWSASHLKLNHDNEWVYQTSILSVDMEDETKTEWLYRMGPYLLRQPSELLTKKWQFELGKLSRICQQLTLSEAEESRGKEAQYRAEMKQIKEVLACLPTVKPSSS
ncbi:SAM-dependent methyltransferase [Paenibacillus baekrokdamisoli]|uniref:SAM-dependent methyltransferase n=1 Tax=Paenibacillus baekrokdamisoli TaxID=1712516 RepID=A0A3G9J8S4_9BACL|nr:class I SAM-dependent methyltransferase [Paenibacillus baekrokdamisoli]MBB3070258.1 tRNA (adenine22-N1)-methyltransferase [Paenibacillus baekrokdamisoli]BBH21263.1 SAM-dependent methyltransferase [Paenibacillus baekrokdamisoli]